MGRAGAALVVGAGPGLGGAVCRRFAGAGYAIAAVRRRHGDELAALCDEIAAAGGSARGFETDARSEDQVVELFDRVESELGAPDDVAATYLAVRQQPRSAWTFELDLHPWVERW